MPTIATHIRRRLPNGFGQISEIKGKNLVRPFRAMVTVGSWRGGYVIERGEMRYADLTERARIRELFQTLFDFARERKILKAEK